MDFVVAWTSDGQDGSGLGVYGQRYDAAGGTAGGAFKINKTVTNDQYQPSVAALADGGFVVTWQSYLQDGSGWGIYGQRYDMAGAIAGGEFRINTTVAGDQIRPSVTSLAGGDFVVTWESLDGAGSGTTLCAQRYDPAGAKVGGEVAVDTSVAHSGSSPLVTALAEGGFVVTWQSYLQDGTGRDIYGQLHNAAGATIGSGFKINTTTADSDEQPWPCVTALADGGFEVTWCSNAQDGSGLDIYGQRYDAAGARAGAEFRINATSADSQEQPSVTALVDGGLVVTWMTYLEGSSERGIYGQRYGADGGKIGLEMSLAITGNASDQSFTGTPGDDSLDGGGGADTLSGGGGYDALNGGAGFDTAIFSGAVGSYHFVENGAQVTVTGPDGTDTLTNIEQLNFANLSFSIADRSHFDPLYYLEHNRDVAAGCDRSAHTLPERGLGGGTRSEPKCALGLGGRTGVHRFLRRSDGGVGDKQGRGLCAFRDQHGLFEGRTTIFNGLEYIASYGDLMQGYGANADAGARTTSSMATPKVGRSASTAWITSPPTRICCRGMGRTPMLGPRTTSSMATPKVGRSASTGWITSRPTRICCRGMGRTPMLGPRTTSSTVSTRAATSPSIPSTI